MSYLFTSESVSEGHPDKVADQISDALIDHFLAYDPSAKVACETMVTTGQVILAGEVKSSAYLDVQDIARKVINNIGYTKSEYMFNGDSCGVISAIHEQSPDINQGVDRVSDHADFETKANAQGAGDQGMMFGYATNETENYMPLALDLAHTILRELSALRRESNAISYLRPDAKSQVLLALALSYLSKFAVGIIIVIYFWSFVGRSAVAGINQRLERHPFSDRCNEVRIVANVIHCQPQSIRIQ